MVNDKLTTFSPDALKKVICSYIPNGLLPTQWFPKKDKVIDNLEDLLDKSNGKLMMFESADALWQQLDTYQKFPRSYNRFNLGYSDMYNNIPTIFQSLKNEKYVYKSDICNVIYTLVNTCPLEKLEAKLVKASVAFFLKIKESKLTKFHEMAHFPSGDLKVLFAELKEINKVVLRETSSRAEQKKDFTSEELINLWKDTLRLGKNGEEEYKEMFGILKNFMEKVPPGKDNTAVYAKLTVYINLVIRKLEIFIDGNSSVFLDRTQSETTNLPIRLFSEKRQNFVMAHELLQSMKNAQLDVSSFEEEALAMPKLATFTFREVLQKVDREAIKNITFVKIPIAASKIRATPIPTIDGGYCILASDALIEILFDMVVAKKIFQIIGKTQWNVIEEFLKSLEHHFNVCNETYFIDLEDVSLIKTEWEKCFERISTHSKVAREIQEVRQNKFTMGYLKKKLERLNLSNIFPEIIDYAGKVPIVGFVQDCDMNEIIERCQHNCILKRFPKLLQFLHNQKACFRVQTIHCQFCMMDFQKTLPKIRSVKEDTKGSEVNLNSEAPLASKGEKIDVPKNAPTNKQKVFKISFTKNQEKTKKITFSETFFESTNIESEAFKKNVMTLESDIKHPEVESELAMETASSDSNEIVPTIPDESSENISGADSESTIHFSSEPSSSNQEETSENNAVVTKKKNKKMKKQNSSANNSETADFNPEERESNSCAKCFRTSEFQMKTADELRLKKIETKHLKKSLLEVELENEKAKKREIQKNTKIQELERRLLSLEKKLTEKDEQIKHLEVQQEALKKENAEKDDRIKIVENYARSQERNVSEQNEIIRNLQSSTPSTSSESPSLRSPEDSEKVKDFFNKLLNIEDTLHIENPISKASEVANRLKMKSENEEVKQTARSELRVFHRQCQFYIKSVEMKLQMIRSNQSITVDQIPALPKFPKFSDQFMNAYKVTMKSDAPKICEALLNSSETPEIKDPQELADKECLICISDIESTEETIKCKCRRRFHTECVSEWFKVKRVCPACNDTLLDPIEFPSL